MTTHPGPCAALARPWQGGLALQPWKPSGPSGATKRASDLLIPSNSPCLPGAFPKPRAAAPVHHVGGPACPPPSHWEDRKGAWPPPALPKPAPAVRARARSLAGPYSLSSLASASRVPKSPSAHFQPATAKPGPQSAFRSPPPGAAGAPTPRSHLVQPPSAKAALSYRRQRCISTWSGLLQGLGSASLLWTQIQQAVNVADHVATSVRKYSVGTLEAYLSLCLRFLDRLLRLHRPSGGNTHPGCPGGFLTSLRRIEQAGPYLLQASPKASLKSSLVAGTHSRVALSQGSACQTPYRSLQDRFRLQGLGSPLCLGARFVGHVLSYAVGTAAGRPPPGSPRKP